MVAKGVATRYLGDRKRIARGSKKTARLIARKWLGNRKNGDSIRQLGDSEGIAKG